MTLLPLGIVLLDPLYRAFERERYFLLRLRLVLAAVLIMALWFFTARLGLLGVIGVVVTIATSRTGVMAIHFGRLLGVTARDVVLLRDIGKLAIAALAAGVVAGVVRLLLLRATSGLDRAGGCGAAFAVVYLAGLFAAVARLLPRPFLGPAKQLRRREFAVMADGKVADTQASDFGTDQLQHFASDGFQHAAHLPIAAFVERDFDERIFRGIADAFHVARAGWGRRSAPRQSRNCCNCSSESNVDAFTRYVFGTL